jgi:hypothetical protein
MKVSQRFKHTLQFQEITMFRSLVLAAAFALGISFICQPAHAQHRFLSQGKDRLAVVNTDGKIEWEMKWGPIHDVHVLPDGHILVQQGAAKIAEIEPIEKKVVWSYDSAKSNGNEGKPVEVHSFQPLGDGLVMIAESGPARIIEIDREGKLLKEIKMKVNHPHPHTDTRLVRKLQNGNYLACHEGDGTVREYNGKGEVVWEYEVPLFDKRPAGGHGPESWGNKCFAAVRLGNGNTLIATGNGHSVIEVTPTKEIAWQVNQKDLEGITLAWVTTIEVLTTGNYLVGNCHAGPEQPTLVEIEPKTKKVVWKLDAGHEMFGNDMSNSVVLPKVAMPKK